MVPLIRRRRYLLAALIFIILIVPTLNNLPYGDDNVFVFESYLQDVPSIFNFWDPYSNFFRSWPLSFSVFSLLLKTFGKNIVIFRLVNVVLHILNAYIFKKTIKYWRPDATPREKYLVFALFLFHPIALVTVNWVFQLKTLLCMTFTLLVLLFFEKGMVKNSVKNGLIVIGLFALALSSKVASVLFPFYALMRWKAWKNKTVFSILTILLFLMSGFAGLINLKGINSFLQEKTTSLKQVTDYGESFEKVAVEPDFNPSSYYHTDLSHQLMDSAGQLSNQFESFESLKLKVIISLFTFGRYINSSLGLNRYSLVYEPTWASLSPGLVECFIGVSFIFLLAFASRKNWKELGLCLLFFLPISGLFYVPYMKFSYIADHWFYLSLPFFLSAVVIGKTKTFKSVLAVVIFCQFLATTYDFRSTEAITSKSLQEYRNPFLYSYILNDLERRGKYQEAYDLVDEYILAKGHMDELAIKTRLRLNIEHLKNDFFERDLERFLKYSLAKTDYATALKFLQKFKGVLPEKKEKEYQTLFLGLSRMRGPK